jgi:hypothetical protein
MAAYIEKRAEYALLIPHQKNGQTREIMRAITAAVRQVVAQADAQGLLPEKSCFLQCRNLGVDVLLHGLQIWRFALVGRLGIDEMQETPRDVQLFR